MKKILAALDFSPISEQIYEQAVSLATVYKAELFLLHVVHSLQDVYIGVSLANQEYYGSMGPLYIPDESIIQQLRDQAKEEEQKLDELRQKTAALGIDCHALLLQGEPAKVLVDEAERLNCDLILMGTHGHSLMYKAFLGSTSEEVTCKACRPIMLFPRKQGND